MNDPNAPDSIPPESVADESDPVVDELKSAVEYYRPELFASTEPFLILHFLFYQAIAVLYAFRQPPDLKGSPTPKKSTSWNCAQGQIVRAHRTVFRLPMMRKIGRTHDAGVRMSIFSWCRLLAGFYKKR